MVIDPFAAGIPAAAAKLAATAEGSADAATAIMTTDTHRKEYAIQFQLGGKTCTVGAIGKGSGMIAPNMATMLAFYTTDAAVSSAMLQKALREVVPGTYNQMSVDLDTSTNDTLIVTEHAGDGEGATHLITCEVTGAPDLKTARAVSRSVICSNLFKAAVFGRDATGFSAPSATPPGISPSTRSASGCPAPPARCMSARTQPITPTARRRPPKCWPNTTSW